MHTPVPRSGPAGIRGIHHTGLVVNDLDAAISIYAGSTLASLDDP